MGRLEREGMIMNYDLPEILEAVAKIIQAMAWPLVALAIVFCLRRQIRELLKKIQELKIFGESGLSLVLGNSPRVPPIPSPSVGDSPAARAGDSSAPSPSIPFDKGKYANIYWVAHDLLWTVAVLLSQGSREKILEGLYQSKHHLNEVGFDGTSIKSRLERLYSEADHSSISDWTNERRAQVAQEVQSIARELGGVIATNQSGFKSHPTP